MNSSTSKKRSVPLESDFGKTKGHLQVLSDPRAPLIAIAVGLSIAVSVNNQIGTWALMAILAGYSLSGSV